MRIVGGLAVPAMGSLMDELLVLEGMAPGPAVLLDTRKTSEHLRLGSATSKQRAKYERPNVEQCRAVRLNYSGQWPLGNMGLRLRVWDYDGQMMLLIAEGVPAGMMPVAGHHGCLILAGSHYAPGISSPGPRGPAQNFKNYG